MTNEEFVESIKIEGELWKEYPLGNGDYIASSMGRIVSLKQNKHCLLRQVKYNERNKEYYSVCLFIDGHQIKIRVHKIIALTFLGPKPGPNYEIDHINGDSLDNRASNLRWCTHRDNMKNPTARRKLQLSHKRSMPWYNRIPGTNPKKKKPIVQLLKGSLIKVYSGIVDVEKDGFYSTNVGRVCKGRLKSSGGYQWMYLSDYEKRSD